MKKVILGLMGAMVLMSCRNDEPLIPACMDQKVDEILAGEVWDPPAQIYSYQYEGEQVFYITPRCCDFFGEVYNAACEYICAPDGGISGMGDGDCPDFFQNATDGKLVWEDTRSPCGEYVKVSEQLYASAPEEYGSIEEARITDDCLYIEFGASGCDGDSWVSQLIDSGAIMESSPEQRNIKFSLYNDEECDAYFVREVSFDISPLQISGSNKIFLNLENYETQLVYEY